MKRTLVTVLVALGIVMLLFVVVRFGGQGAVSSIAGAGEESQISAESAELLGNRAPYFDLPDSAAMRVRISDFQGTPLIVVFWATWNEDAADQIKILDDYLASATVSSDLVQVVAIDTQEDKSIVGSFMRRGGYRVPIAIDAKGSVAEEYGVRSLPTFFFIDRDGVIRDAHTGLLDVRSVVNKTEGIVR